MKYLRLGFILILFTFLGACNPFDMNIYSSVDKMKMPDFGDGDELLFEAGQPQLYEYLKNHPGDKDKALKTLENMYKGSAGTETQQKAALMAADVHMKTSGADEVVENLNNVIQDSVDGKAVYEKNKPEAFIKKLFGEKPSGMSDSEYKDKVKKQLKAFQEAAAPLNAYGKTLDSSSAPEGINKGDVAIKAVLAGAASAVLKHVDSDNDKAIEKLADYLVNPAGGLSYKTAPNFDSPSDILKDGNEGILKVVNNFTDIDDLFKK